MILVTGAGGFLGGHLVERLAARGCGQIRCLVRSRSGRLGQLQEKYPAVRLESFCGNLLAAQDLERALSGVTEVFHVAAAMNGSPADLWANTVVASERLLNACHGVKRVVLVSSFGVYGVAGLPRQALVDENTPLEPHPERRDAYSYAKWRQELLFRKACEKRPFELVILRPGVIYGPGGGGLSTRIGIRLPGFLLHVGKSNLLPLTYVENCAEAIAVAGLDARPGEVFNVVDDELVTCREYLRMYKQVMGPLRSVATPYWSALLFSKAIEWYSNRSRGQLPSVLTPYKAATLWKGNRFTNAKLKSIGWRPLVSTRDALRSTFDALATEI